MRIPFIVKSNPAVYEDEHGRYILNPITKEKIYEFRPLPIDNPPQTMMPNLFPVPGLFREVTKNGNERSS